MSDSSDFIKTDELIDKLVDGLNLPTETVNVIKNIYTISSFKNVLEMLFLFRGKDPEFIKSLIGFFKTQTDLIPKEIALKMTTSLEKQSVQLLSNIVTKLSEDLNPEQKRLLISKITSI